MKKKEIKFPEEGEILFGRIKKIMSYGAFCSLDDYPEVDGFIHISEVAPRWIKNIHEFLKDKQRVFVRVIRIDKEKGHIDVSIKRVSKQEAEEKLLRIRMEKRGQKLFEQFVNEQKMKKKDAEKLSNKMLKRYRTIYECLEEIVYEGPDAIKGLRISKKIAEKLIEFAKKNIKKQVAKVEGLIDFVSYAENGVEVIKKSLGSLEFEKKEESLKIFYFGAPRYMIRSIAEDYKKAEKNLNNAVKKLMKIKNAHVEYQRIKNK